MKQEPVAWLSERLNDGSKRLSFYEPPNTDGNPDYKVEPLYTLNEMKQELHDNNSNVNVQVDKNPTFKGGSDIPIAIVNPNKENNIQWLEESKKWNGYFLYTSPQYRELSDDEIIDVWDKVNYESQYYEASDNFALEFAKAILERSKK